MNGSTIRTLCIVAAAAVLGIAAPAQSSTCPADFDADSQVNAADLAVLLGAWSIPVGTPGCGGALPCVADINGDTLVNAADLALLLGAWGPTGNCGVTVTGSSPSTGCRDTIITITGTGFGNDPDDLCIRLVDENVSARALTATNTVVTARVGNIPPGTGPSQWMVFKGQGESTTIPDGPVLTTTLTWAWSSDSGPEFGDVSPQLFTPIPESHEVDLLGCIPEENEHSVLDWFLGPKPPSETVGPSQPLQLRCLPANPCSGFTNWPFKTKVELDCHFDMDCGSGVVHYDVYLPTAYVVPMGGGAASAVATALANNLVVAFNGTGSPPFTISTGGAGGTCILIQPDPGCTIIPYASGNYGHALVTCPPTNDNCAGAGPPTSFLFGSPAVKWFDTAQATTSAGGTSLCGTLSDDLWFQYQSSSFSSSSVKVSTCFDPFAADPFTSALCDFDTIIEVYSACGGTLLGCNNDNPAGCNPLTPGGSYVEVTVTPGQSIWVRVGGAGGAFGTGTLEIHQP